MKISVNDHAIWRHLMNAIEAILEGKRQTAIQETKKALTLLQSTQD